MYVEQSLFGAFFDIACEQNVLMTCADAQHATLVVVVRTDAVLIRMQDIELHTVPVPAHSIPAAAHQGRAVGAEFVKG